MTNLSSPNRIVWEYFAALRRLVAQSRSAEGEAERRQCSALAVVMSVTVVEVFVNLWFRVHAEQHHTPEAVAVLVSELGHPRPWSLDKKLKNWPMRYLGNELDLSSGSGAEFMRIKDLRNSIVHFNSTHTTVKYEGIEIQGLADTTDYNALSHEKALHALLAAENLIAEVFNLSGVEHENIKHLLHAWTGRPPV
jgi:hypothetical protein